MPHLTLLLLLLLCTCGPAQLPGQPRPDPVRTVTNLKPILRPHQQRWAALQRSRQFEAALALEDTIQLTVLGQYVTPSYLIDRQGNVWNLGTMNLPFVIHTFREGCFICETFTDAINTVANEFAEEVITFLLLPRPTKAETELKLDQFNENVIVVFDDYSRDPDRLPKGSTLLGMVGYPTTYFVTPERMIVGLDGPFWNTAYLAGKKGKAKFRKQGKDLTKLLRRQVEKLLRR